jgi:hypothetical protein
MADIRCPSCGKDNPDFLDVCQFCQTPLKPESMVHIGDKPTKKNTGELEPVLPEWLRDVRKQARDSAEEDAAETASMPKVQKDEPPDLLAGLAFQSAKNEEEDVPDWLSSLSSKPDEKPSSPAAPAEPKSDFFAKFEKSRPAQKSEPEPEETSSVSGLSGMSSDSPERDELSDWFAEASKQPVEPFSLEPDAPATDSGWELNEETPPAPKETASQPREEEDLGWLRSLEAEAKKTGELSSPRRGEGGSFGFDAPGEDSSKLDDDLSWLNNLGALPASEEPVQQASHSGDDLGWLNDFAETSESSQPEPKPSASQDDLSWLNNLDAPPASEEPVQQAPQPKEDLGWLNAFAETSESPPPESTSPVSQDDLSWLDELGGVSQPPQSSDLKQDEPTPQEDLSWLSNLQSSSEPLSAAPFEDASSEQDQAGVAGEKPGDIPHVSPFTPRRTAPLSEESNDSIPDWLKSATDEPSMPLGPQALDQFREDYHIPSTPEEPFSWKSFVQGIEPADEGPAPDRQQPPFVDPDLYTPAGDSSTLSNQDVDSLFSMDMPDWLSHPEPAGDEAPTQDIGIHAEGGEALSPADLPSWVQAMRPMEAVISEVLPNVEDQPAEREGPLAGLKGVIPAAPIGSSRRPQPIPLKLQATDEQQTSAAILEEILLGETTSSQLVSAPVVISQRVLRWVIAALVLIVLGTVVFMRSEIMPVSALLPPHAQDVTNVVMNISEDAPVLVVLDYEPALAGEMEAVSGPLLDQLVLLRHPHLSFLATSPNGTALVERLLVNTNINQPDGHAYIAGQNYTNMGYLPGGESGVLAFIQSPQTAIQSSPVLGFSEYAAILLLTDHADSARMWVEQLHALKQADPALASQPLLAVSSAQTGPMLQPYVSSRQINGLISGMSDAARYESMNNSRPGIARSYWDAFGVGVMMAVLLIVLGSLWSVFTGIRSRRAEAAEE